jgi:hypothetical protein
MAFDNVFSFRGTNELKARYGRLARQPENRGRDEADLYRMALEDYCDFWEKRLGLKPITPEEVEELTGLLLAERSGATTIQPRPTGQPVSYKGKLRATGSGRTPRKLPGHAS